LNRQFIFTTHNANIAVASDADKFHVFESTADACKIIFDGAIDRTNVKKSVLEHLEGGSQPYDLRRKKYNL
jgi:hypothetical protein